MKRPEGFDPAKDATGREGSANSRGARRAQVKPEKAAKNRKVTPRRNAGHPYEPVATVDVVSTPATAKKRADRNRAVNNNDHVSSTEQRATAAARTPRSGSAARRSANESRASRAHLRASSRERRRFERREVRRFTRHSRHRRLAWMVGLSVVAVVAGLLAFAVYSPVLALRTITVEGTSSVSADDVLTAIDGQVGTPLALLDYAALRSQLDEFPMIRSFSTEIIPPSTLKVHIVERSPVGVVTAHGGFTVVDPAGVVLESAERRPEGLPLIDLAGGDTDSVAFTAVVDVILALPESIRSRVDVAQATSKDDVRLVLTDAGERVRWGSSERSALKARVLEELMASQSGNSNLEFDVSAPLSPVVRVG